MKIVRRHKTAMIWLWLSTLIIIVDQISKYVVLRNLQVGEPYVFLPFLNINVNFNRGAAFSFLDSAGGWQVYFFMIVSLGVALFLLVGLIRTKRSERIMALGMS